MFDIKECCRLCIKPKQQSMKDCADDPLALTIQDIFGIEFVVNGPLSTKICRECIYKVLDIHIFKNTVQNNQATLEEYRSLQESLQLSPSEVKQEDDDDVILVGYDAPNSNTNDTTLEQYGENIKRSKPIKTEPKVKTFFIKRSVSPAPVEGPVPKKIKLKKLKILCQPITLKDVSKFRLKESDKRILKLNGKKVEREKKSLLFKEIEQKSCEPTSLAAKNLISIIARDSEDKGNKEIEQKNCEPTSHVATNLISAIARDFKDEVNDFSLTLKDYLDKSNKSSAKLSETANVSMSSTSGISTPQNVASVSSLTIPLPTLAPDVKVDGNSNLKQYAAKNAFSKQKTSTPVLTQMPKHDILNNTPRNVDQLKLVVNQANLANLPKPENQPNPANLPKPANQLKPPILSKPVNQLKPQILPKPASQPKPFILPKPTNQMVVIHQPFNKPAPKTTQSGVFYTNVNATQRIPPTNTNINTQPISTIPTVRFVAPQPKVIEPATVPAPPVPASPVPVIQNVCSIPPQTIPKNAEQTKISKLFISNGKVFNDQGGYLGAVGNSLKHIQALAQLNGNTLTFKVTPSDAQRWQAVIDKRNAEISGGPITIPMAGTTMPTVSGPQIPSVPSTSAASSSMKPFSVQLKPSQESPRPITLEQPNQRPIDGPRPPPPIITPGISRLPPPIISPGISPYSTFVDPVIDNRVKVLSVNELNNRAADGSSDTRKLPIRIALVKTKNEVQIKLADSKNNEIHYSELSAQEQAAVKTSLLQPCSKAQIMSAIRSCKPDPYSEKMLQAFGISVTDLT